MMAVPFEGSRSIGKPRDMSDEQCSSLEVLYEVQTRARILMLPEVANGVDLDMVPFYVSHWIPSQEDIAALVAGRGLWLKICGTGHPPVALYTLDENGEGNF